MLSKHEWSADPHDLGEEWTLEKLLAIRQKVDAKELEEIPCNIKGCMEKPLFDTVPISNYVIPVLHVIIGIGNALVGSIFEWVEQRVEQLAEAEIISRNNILSAEINLDDAVEEYNNWLQNEGIRLTECMLEKKGIQVQLKAKDDAKKLIIMDRLVRRELNDRNRVHLLLKPREYKLQRNNTTIGLMG
jgi:hypothetical protein